MLAIHQRSLMKGHVMYCIWFREMMMKLRNISSSFFLHPSILYSPQISLPQGVTPISSHHQGFTYNPALALSPCRTTLWRDKPKKKKQVIRFRRPDNGRTGSG